MSATRLAARLASREARRRPWRSLLVVALVAVPVIGMTVATMIIRTDNRSALEEWDDLHGSADLVLAGEEEDLLPNLPTGTSAVRYTFSHHTFRDAGHRASVDVVATPLEDAIWQGRFDVVDGRPPMAGGEVALSSELADRFGVAAGDTLELVHPDLSLDVAGVVEDRTCVRCEAVYAAPAAPNPFGGAPGGTQLNVDLPGRPTAEVLDHLPSRYGIYTGSVRPVPGLATHDANTAAAIRWSIVIGALALAAVGIVIAAAFAVGARRQLVLLGQLSANGASERVLRRVLFLQGTVTGLVGSTVGLLSGYLLLQVFHEHVEWYLDRRFSSYDVSPRDLLTIGAVGVAGASLAALVPARTAARVPTLQALAGRRPLNRVPGSVTGGGLIAAVAGLGLLAVASVGSIGGRSGHLWAAVAIVGGLGVLFGATALTPAMVSALEPVARRTGGVVRLATRSLARNRSRTGAIVAAVAAAGALAVGGTAAARTVEQTRFATLPTDVVLLSTGWQHGTRATDHRIPEAARTELQSALPDAQLVPVPVAVHPFAVTSPQPGYAFTDSGALVVDNELGSSVNLSDDARRALAETGAVVIRHEDKPRLDITLTFQGAEPVETAAIFSRHSIPYRSATYVTPDLADRLDLRITGGPVVAISPGGLDEVERFDLERLAADLWGTSGDLQLEFQNPTSYLEDVNVEILLAAVSVLFALGVVGIGLALAAADERDERATLTVIGAGPAVVARATAAKAWVLATLGFALAVPVGFLPVVTVISSNDRDRSLEFPVDTVATLVVLVPVLAAAGAFVASRISQRVRPLRVSTATFE